MSTTSDFMSHTLENDLQYFVLRVSIILNSSVWSILNYYKHNMECRIASALQSKGLTGGGEFKV